MGSLASLPNEDLRENFSAYRLETERHADLERTPAEISDLASQGYEPGVEESTMINAATRAPKE